MPKKITGFTGKTAPATELGGGKADTTTGKKYPATELGTPQKAQVTKGKNYPATELG
jgi:hypothetical protein